MKKNLKDTEFKTLSEYVTFLLRVIAYEDADVSTQDVEKIRERLKKLGYID